MIQLGVYNETFTEEVTVLTLDSPGMGDYSWISKFDSIDVTPIINDQKNFGLTAF
jgi:chlorite dismutase